LLTEKCSLSAHCPNSDGKNRLLAWLYMRTIDHT
jgi:hypothetical protein